MKKGFLIGLILILSACGKDSINLGTDLVETIKKESVVNDMLEHIESKDYIEANVLNFSDDIYNQFVLEEDDYYDLRSLAINETDLIMEIVELKEYNSDFGKKVLYTEDGSSDYSNVYSGKKIGNITGLIKCVVNEPNGKGGYTETTEDVSIDYSFETLDTLSIGFGISNSGNRYLAVYKGGEELEIIKDLKYEIIEIYVEELSYGVMEEDILKETISYDGLKVVYDEESADDYMNLIEGKLVETISCNLQYIVDIDDGEGGVSPEVKFFNLGYAFENASVEMIGIGVSNDNSIAIYKNNELLTSFEREGTIKSISIVDGLEYGIKENLEILKYNLSLVEIEGEYKIDFSTLELVVEEEEE